MPDLGKYSDTVLSAYGLTIVLLVGLVVLSLRASRKSLKDLKSLEKSDG
ncbi:MAG: heme exporter protein CcmD [Cognatishimia sp.]